MGGTFIFSFISMSDLNNLRKFITTTVYVIKIIMELAPKSPWLTGKATGHESKGKPKVGGSRLVHGKH